jgi:hypothetical protein
VHLTPALCRVSSQHPTCRLGILSCVGHSLDFQVSNRLRIVYVLLNNIHINQTWEARSPPITYHLCCTVRSPTASRLFAVCFPARFTAATTSSFHSLRSASSCRPGTAVPSPSSCRCAAPGWPASQRILRPACLTEIQYAATGTIQYAATDTNHQITGDLEFHGHLCTYILTRQFASMNTNSITSRSTAPLV